MKKENAYKLCHLIAALFMIGFPLKIIKDWVTYNTTLNSAPFFIKRRDFLYFCVRSAFFRRAARFRFPVFLRFYSIERRL